MTDNAPQELIPQWAALSGPVARLLAGLRASGVRVITAESCTGGLLAAALTHFPGSSESVEGGFVTYSNTMKQAVLGVQAQTLKHYGAVSSQTVHEMAEGALRVATLATLSIAISGIAGPGGARPDKPVGLVWFGTALRGGQTRTDSRIFIGSRASVRSQAVEHALSLLAQRLEEYGR